jgi:hypothetical protein
MKKIVAALMVLNVFVSSCKKNPAPATQGDLTIKFNTVADGKTVKAGVFDYVNAAGNRYSISLLKYYVTNVVLVADDNTEYKLNNYDLIDAFSPASFSTVESKNVPFANYTKMKFLMGVDKDRNHSGAQDGDLDPMYNMIWTWSTGYLFLKHEGLYINSSNDTVDIQYHLGTDRALSSIEIPITLNMDATAKTLNIQFDLNKMYNSPVINFNDGNIIHSTLAADQPWIDKMVSNTSDVFTYLSQE